MDSDSLPERLRIALRSAMKTKDTAAVSALRSALAAIGNAEAVPTPGTRAGNDDSQHIAGGTSGVASAEAPRRRLTPEETARLVRDEISDRHASANAYEAAGHPERAERLRHEARAIQSACEAG